MVLGQVQYRSPWKPPEIFFGLPSAVGIAAQLRFPRQQKPTAFGVGVVAAQRGESVAQLLQALQCVGHTEARVVRDGLCARWPELFLAMVAEARRES